jgi:hypothetical protein
MLAIGSCDLFQAKKKIIVVKTEQIKKIPTIFIQMTTFDYFHSNPLRSSILIFIHLYFHKAIKYYS